MKKRLLRRNRLLFVLPVLLFASSLGVLGMHEWRQRHTYRSYVVDPISGKYDPLLASFILPITRVSGDTVSITMGDYGPDAGVAQTVLLFLSPTLRMHREAQVFKVSWSQTCCSDGGTNDGGQELIYDRSVGQVFYHSKGWEMSKPYDRTEIVASGIDDTRIHEAAALNKGYGQL